MLQSQETITQLQSALHTYLALLPWLPTKCLHVALLHDSGTLQKGPTCMSQRTQSSACSLLVGLPTKCLHVALLYEKQNKGLQSDITQLPIKRLHVALMYENSVEGSQGCTIWTIKFMYSSYSWLQVKRGTKHVQVQLHYLQQVALYWQQWNSQFWQWLPPHRINNHSTNVV